jgi:hypothetical protein
VAMEGSVLLGAVLFGQQIWNYWKPRRIGIYGATQVGKTTLDRYMTTPGEMEEIPEDERTRHLKRLIGDGHVLPNATRKRVRYEGEKRVVHSSDIGGERDFWSLWIDDMVDRQVEGIVYMYDDRSKNGGVAALEAVAGFEYLVDTIINRQYRYRRLRTRFKGKRYAPKFIWLVANKADRWWDPEADVLWQQQRLREHKIFDPFRAGMIRLQKAGIICRVSMMSTRIGWNVERTMFLMLNE